MERSIELVGQRLDLREFTPDDWPAVHLYGSDPEVVCFQLWGPNDEEQTRAFLRMALAERTGPKRSTCNLAIVLKDENLLVGGCHLQLDAKTAGQGDFGYCLRRSHWGQGYATEAGALLLDFAFGPLGLERLVATCDARNERSWRVMERLEMQREALRPRPDAKRPVARHAGLCHQGGPVAQYAAAAARPTGGRTMKCWIAGLAFCLGALAAAADEPAKPAKVEKPELRNELLARRKVDQEARLGFIEWMKKHGISDDFDQRTGEGLDPVSKAEFDKLMADLEKADKENTDWLKQLVDKSGWPKVTLVGKEGAEAAWLLVQHADAEPKFQRKCLDLMTALPKDEVSQRNLAYLTDRVLLAEGKKQIYGTQFQTVDGKMEPKPLDDPANVDRRRAEAGLEPLAEYARQLAEVYGGKLK